MTQDQQTQLDQITATSEDGKWFAMWSVLFPDTDPPSSPYADADDLGGFMAGEVHRLWRPLYRALLRPFMDDDQFERYHNLLMRTSSSYLSTFSSSLAGRGPIPYADGQPSSLNPSLEHWVQNIPEELPNNTGRGFSPVMSPSAFLPATPQAGSYTLPDDDASLDASSSHTIDSTGNLSIPQGMPDDPENTVDGLMRPEEAPHLMSAFTAGQFPVHNNQYTNTLPPVNRYQESNPNPSTSGFGFGPTNSPLHAGYVYGPQIYDPGVFQNSSLSNFYGTRSPQQLQTAAIVDQLMSQYGDGNYTPHITSPGMIGFSQVARHQSGGHAPEPVGDDVSVPQRRRQHNQFERTGPRHC
ncbi:hypothetical protein CGRA01v4_07954 [Colletotrichum graminicola]|uniref:Uncharacterized protein n=1 Tax=Colletotrichum graminicola (strain M1.001 / M2 / FGSC 10212) TaxID=645133 RepID=E3Q7U7_COLGM|nr:uncharacterized protein GLRG_02130 [Colletotrichum graminicola M1.001]EFQ26959.1 hypothetical protein GLRG_02130 [Colletotrichum graminicola M1.001]WDK16671.1 hypothetical protein CGRA01v4_07954 [Colletotrichum graminicola]